MNLHDRYLELLKGSLLNLFYLENEVRLLYVFSMLAQGKPVDAEVVRIIGKKLPRWVEQVTDARKTGKSYWQVELPDGRGGTRPVSFRNICEFSHTMVGKARLDNLQECLDVIRKENIPGDIIETGVWRGGASIFMKGCLEAWDMGDRTLWCADSFEGLPVPTHPEDAGYDFSASQVPILAIPLDEVQDNFKRYGLLDDRVRFLKGWFSETLPSAPIESLALLRLDGDLYESTMDGLLALYDKVVPGGFIVIDDYGDFEPCRKAIDDFRASRGITEPIVPIDWAGAYWRKR